MRARQVVSQFTARLNDILYRRGEVCFDEHTLADLDDRVSLGAAAKYTIMAACPGNSLTTAHDIDRAVDMLVEAARPLVAPMVEALGTEVENAQTRVNGPAGWNDQ
jgi:hypothetical protein